MRKILIIIPTLYQAGGTERAGVSLANMLSGSFDVSILDLSIGFSSSFYIIDSKVKVLHSEFGLIPSKFYSKALYFHRLKKYLDNLISRNDFEIVIGLGHNINSVISILNSKNIKKIGCEHVSYNSIPKFSKILMKISYSKLDAIVVLSFLAKKNISYLNEKVFVIPNAIPFTTSKIAELDNTRIIMVGRLVVGKGYERLVGLAKYLKSYHPEWEILIFGEGELYCKLLSLYEKENLKNIKIYKFVKNIQEEYLKASLLLSCSYSEAMPMVFLEAMSVGLPIISFRNEGANLLINNEIDGYLVEDDKQLIDKVKILINDKNKRKSLGKQGIVKASEYSKDNVKIRWLNLINSL